MNKQSKKHHYLPRNYLKGFTNENGSFFVYDKKNDNIFKSSPGATFFENNLNTVTFPDGHSSDFLEEIYTHMENQAWQYLDNIRDSTSTTAIPRTDKLQLFLFLLFLHWRLPSNSNFAERLSEKAFQADDGLSYLSFEDKDGSSAPSEIIKMIRDSSAFKKSVKLLAPFAPFYKDKNWGRILDNWRFLYAKDNKNWYVVGDNPIITEGVNDHDPVNCLKEFVFPVSGRILLVNTLKPISTDFPPEIVLQYGTAIIERANRFVACQREDFLGALVQYYKFHAQHGKTASIIPELFQTLKA